jgi:hypothetical protein
MGRADGRDPVSGPGHQDEADDFLGKSLSAGRMGKAVEYLVAAGCIVATRGELNVATSLVDDEGVDLVFNRRGSSAILAVRVKARMSDSKRVQSGSFVSFVRSQTFRPRPDLYMLFVAVEITEARILTAWLVPSEDFAAIAGNQNSRGRLRFYASMKAASRDRWRYYRLQPAELAPQMLARLTEIM